MLMNFEEFANLTSEGERILFHLIHYLDEFHGNNLGDGYKSSDVLLFNLVEIKIVENLFMEVEGKVFVHLSSF